VNYIPARFIITDNWLYAEGQKICRLQDGKLIFCYKSKTKSERVGTREFGIDLSALSRAVDELEKRAKM